MSLEPYRRLINRSSISAATNLARDYAEKTRRQALNLANDPERAARTEKGECPVCYYILGRIGGTVCTKALCGLCGTVLSSGNACVDSLCLACAKDNSLCKYCSGDVEMKNRRMPRPYECVEKS